MGKNPQTPPFVYTEPTYSMSLNRLVKLDQWNAVIWWTRVNSFDNILIAHSSLHNKSKWRVSCEAGGKSTNSGGEGVDRGYDGWMESPTQQTWVWASSGSWWWTGKPGVLQSMVSQRVRNDWMIEVNWTGGQRIYLKSYKQCDLSQGTWAPCALVS